MIELLDAHAQHRRHFRAAPASRAREDVSMTDEEFAAALEDAPDPPPPSAYPLGCDEGRRGFLEAYIWRGEVALFEAVNHIWNQLLEPKTIRCTMIGAAAGTGGTGKKALIPFLRRALRESLDNDIPQPWGQDYPDIHAYHAAATAYLAADFSHYEQTVQKYANLMNSGEPPHHDA
jgi:hypothetical protein